MIHRSLTLTTAPAAEPLSTAEAKVFLRVDHDDDDTLIDSLVAAARHALERFTGRAFITQSWTMYLDGFGVAREPALFEGVRTGPWLTTRTGVIEVPRPPLASLTTFKWYNEADTATTVAASIYYVDTNSEPGRIALRTGHTWPADTLRAANGVEIVFQAGYGSAGSDMPPDLLQAVRKMTAYLYEKRDEGWDGKTIPTDVVALAAPYRMIAF